jgi:predicted glycogen debranching enzyme
MEDSMASASGTSGLDDLVSQEWLTTNQIGGYACSTAAGLNTRKYHGLLVASMATPVRRMVLLSRVEENLIINGEPYPLASSEYPGAIHPDGYTRLRAFSHEPHPRWAYQNDHFTLEKSLRMVRGENTVVLSYTLLTADAPVKLELRPLFALRGIHELNFQWNGQLDAQKRSTRHYRIPPTSRTPEVFFSLDGRFDVEGCWYMSTIYRREEQRGYAGLEDLWMPGVARWTLHPGQTVHFVCSTEPVRVDDAVAKVQRQVPALPPMALGMDATVAALLRAADQFVVQQGKSAVGVIAQYPWASPSGRDAMIGFTGLLLVPRRFAEAAAVLERMIEHLRDGLMPSEFPEDGSAPRYLGADVSLWFIQAVHDYIRYTNDESPLRARLCDAVVRIIRSYQAGTRLGIGIDADGLLISHEPGRGTSWMDAKVGDWVITPRQGRPVELNALWYNALRIASQMCDHAGRNSWSSEFSILADSVKQSFNRRFWNEMAGCCFDVVTDRGADPSIRPNQLLAISLPHAVLADDRHARALEKVRSELLTAHAVRTLACGDPSFQPHYRGDVVSRDRAYHQGSAYPWLLGPYIKAMLKARGRSASTRAEALQCLDGVLHHLTQAGTGQICELFDATALFAPGGAIASARSVGQVLQAYAEDVLELQPRPLPAAAASPAKSPTAVKPPVVGAG